MWGNTWWSTKVDAKLLSDLVIISVFSSNNPLDFHESIPVVPLKYLMYSLAGINTKQFWSFPEENFFDSLRILNYLSHLLLIFLLILFDSFLSEVTFSFNFLFIIKIFLFYEIRNVICAC